MPKCIICKKREIADQKRLLCYHCKRNLIKENKLPPVTSSMVLAWRKARLIDKYGPNIISDLALVTKVDGDFSLTDFAKKYGFTRENSRQMFITIFGYPYTQVKKIKKSYKLNKKINMINYNDPELLDNYNNLNFKKNRRQTMSNII